jgi:hypothetical protein
VVAVVVCVLVGWVVYYLVISEKLHYHLHHLLVLLVVAAAVAAVAAAAVAAVATVAAVVVPRRVAVVTPRAECKKPVLLKRKVIVAMHVTKVMAGTKQRKSKNWNQLRNQHQHLTT